MNSVRNDYFQTDYYYYYYYHHNTTTTTGESNDAPVHAMMAYEGHKV